MKIFRVLLAGLLMASNSFTFAQDSYNKSVTLAILGGLNFQDMIGTDAFGDKLENEIIIGYHAGINIQIPLTATIFFQPGLLYSTKGAENKASISTFKLSYIEMPLNVVFKGDLGKGKILLGFGPYVGYGIAGKVILESGAVSQESAIEFKNVIAVGDPILTTYFRALDAGSNVFLGYEFARGIFLQLNSQFGMIKINPEYELFTSDKSIVKNTGFGLSMGYKF